MRSFILNSAGLIFLLSFTVNAQHRINVSGFVKDRDSGERLIGANITETGTPNGTITEYNGYFNLVVRDNPSLRVSFIGYEDQVLNLNAGNDTIIDVALSRNVEQLSEVTISAERKQNVNISTLDYAQMTQTPSLGGKPDVIKALQLLPGISSQKEGSSLMIVRGGDPGQNLYLFDNVPIIYVNHLGGFMSVFNPEIINNIDVYKGGFPSRYGGKLSSVMDITQREGDYSTYKGSFSAGITDLSFNFEGPAGFKNSSFIVGARKTLFDPLMALIQLSPVAEGDYILVYGFHDFNGKFSWKPDQKKSLSLNFYQGDDYLNYWSLKGEKYRMGDIWGNWLVSAKYNTILSTRLFSSTSLSFTRYRLREFMKYNLPNQDAATTIKESYKSSVRDLSFRSGMKFTASERWLAEFGIQSTFMSMNPNETYLSAQAVQQTKPVNSFETAIYADNKFIVKDKWSITPGFRINNHLTRGFSDLSFEPRLNADMQLSKNHSLSISYMKVSQYSHLIFTTGSIMNNEVWIPAGKNIPPAKSDQATAGWNGSFMNGKFTSGLSFYYKDMYNLTTYKDGYTSMTGDENWITKVETGGKGRSMGMEFLIRKNSGNWTGFISYVRSKTTRQFLNINSGKQYLFDYNRPNNLSVNLNRKIKNNLNLNLVWIYQSGLPFTEAIGRQYMPSVSNDFQGNDFFYEGLIYGERNGARMRDYHRLDVGLTWSRYNRRNNKVDWNFSIYNLYNRHNPVFYYYNSNKSLDFINPQWNHDFRPLSLYQLSLFPVMPSISCKVYFDREARNARIESLKAAALQRTKEVLEGSAITSKVSGIKDRWNIKAGYSLPLGPLVKYDFYKIKKYSLELNYGFLKNVEAGVYGGYSTIHLFERVSPNGTLGYTRSGFYYGVNCNYHLLPYVVKKDDLRFDLYVTGKLGGVTIKSTKSYEEHCLGGGAAIYLFEHLGFFGEYTYGKFYNKPPKYIFEGPVHKKVNFGLAIKFR